ncbi:hypothetical protein K7432_008024 [Basidiobolus ranarum]|uniref:LITAF domain-containing protein n=1 Tax=Basidiobolus ranarum TaxID=34480 RepID=A0ABR2WSF4_9FUNG
MSEKKSTQPPIPPAEAATSSRAEGTSNYTQGPPPPYVAPNPASNPNPNTTSYAAPNSAPYAPQYNPSSYGSNPHPQQNAPQMPPHVQYGSNRPPHMTPVMVAPVETVVIVNSRKPVAMVCPFCRTDIVTKANHTPGFMSGCGSVLLCFICWPLFWVPFVCTGCMDVVHTCPRCRNTIAVTPS